MTRQNHSLKHRCHRPSVKGFFLLTLAMTGALMLSACGSTGPRVYDNGEDLSSISDPRARQMLSLGQIEQASDRYTDLASRARDPLIQEDYLLVATEILYDRGRVELGATKKAMIPESLQTLENQQRLQILNAKDSLFNDDPEAALLALPTAREIVSPLHRARAYEVQAQSYRLLEQPDRELAARINLEQQLTNTQIIDKNHRHIWQLLTSQSQSTLKKMGASSENAIYVGWLDLAMASAAGGSSPESRNLAFQEWRGQYPGHPAEERFLAQLSDPNNLSDFNLNVTTVDQIGVLLPMSMDGIDAFAAAIRDGIIVAYQNSQDQRTVPRVKFYDTGSNIAFVRNIMQEAVADGADAIIGPLRKDAVASIATMRDVPVPVITLNYIDSSQPNASTDNVIQFGLAPEDEARSAASRALALGLRQAIILQSDDSRGDREARAFQDEMLLNGGEVLHTAVLPSDVYDYSQQIRDALLITQSDRRFRNIQQTLDSKLFFEPSIRDDLDVIFLAISSEEAQSVRPQLSFFRAHNVLKLGTSRIATIDDDPKARKDLNGIFFNDAPWQLDQSVRNGKLYREIARNFPDNIDIFSKLYALGIDAYYLATNLQELTSIGGTRIPGYTGDLELGFNGRIRRHLQWAKYEEGEVVGVKTVELKRPTISQN